MHSVVARLSILPGKRAAFLAYSEHIRDFVQRQPGFRGEVLFNSRGYPAHYTYSSAWETRADLLAALRSDELVEINTQERAAEIYSLLGPLEVYTQVFTVAGPAAGKDMQFLGVLEWTISVGGAEAFLALRRQVAEILATYGRGMGTYAVWQSLAEPARYAIVLPFATDEDATASVSTPEYRAWAAQHPLLEGAVSLTRTVNDVLRVTVPAAAGAR